MQSSYLGIPDHLTCLLRNLDAGQEATVRTLYGTSWFKTEKGVQQGWLLSPCLLNLHPGHIVRNAGLDALQARITTGERNNHLRCADDTTLMAESKEELKSLSRVKESERASLKLNIKKKGGSSDRFPLLGLQKSLQTVTTDIKSEDDCFLEGKRWHT